MKILHQDQLKKRHAKELFNLTDASRTYLREWLPWIDFTKTVADSEKFIDMTLNQFASNNGFWVNDKVV